MLKTCAVLIFIFVSTFTIISVVPTESRFQVLFKNVSLDCKTELVTGSVSFNSTQANAQVTLHEISLHRVTIHYQLDVKVKDDANRINEFTTFLNRTMELCEFFKNPMSEPLEWMLYRELIANKANYIFNSCPIKPDTYFIKNMMVNPALLPPTLTNLDFIVTGEGYVYRPKRLKIFGGSIVGSIQSRRGRQRNRG